MTRWQRRSSDERGAVFVFVAIALTVLLGSAALAVDIGQVTNNNRTMQAVADVVALDAVRALGGGVGAVGAAASDSAVRNNFPPGQLTVELGTKIGSDPFQVNPVSPNAVRVTAVDSVDYAFAPGEGSSRRSAVAVQTTAAGFSVGSFLASIPAGGNTVLSAIFGDAFGLSVLSYDGLANADVTLEAIGLNMPVQMTPSQLVGTSINMREFFLASVQAVDPSNTAAVNLLNALAVNVPVSQTIRLGDAIDIEQGGEGAAATAQMNLLQMLTANALVLDGTHTLTIPEASLTLPASIGDVKLTLQVTEPSKTVFGPVGTVAQTAQVRATVEPTIRITTGSGNVNACGLGDVLKSLLSLSLFELTTCLLGGVVNRVLSLDLTAKLPVSVEAVGAKATLTDITCGSPKGMALTPELQPATLTGSAAVRLTGTVLGVSLGDVLQVNGSLNASVTSTPPVQNFVESEFGVPRQIGATSLGLGSTHPMTFSSATILNANVAGPLNTVTGVVGGLLNTALAQVGTAVLEPLNRLLGLNLFGADLTALNVECGGVRLAE